jgi:hypothetical protein
VKEAEENETTGLHRHESPPVSKAAAPMQVQNAHETEKLPASMAPLPKRDERFTFTSPIRSSLPESVSSVNRNA